MRTYITKPIGFNFHSTVISHGWSELPPFSYDQETQKLSYVFSKIDAKGPVSATIFDLGTRIAIETEPLNAYEKRQLVKGVRHILRLVDDITAFHQIVEQKEDFAWIKAAEAGRLIRSESVYEDLIKTICTTNCSWSLTMSMVRNLCEQLGERTSEGIRAFPTPAALASKNEEFYRAKIRAGYRSPYFAQIGQAISDGTLDPESWLGSELSSAELKREIKKVKGIGDYASENLLKLVGRYDGLALDSWLRGGFYKKYCEGKPCEDAEIEEHYKEFGEFCGLAIWMDMSRRWYEDQS